MDVETIAIVMGVVEALKRAGVTGKASFTTALVLAFALFAGEQAALTWPVLDPFFRVILFGLYGAAATGWYDLVSKATTPAVRQAKPWMNPRPKSR